MCLLEIICWKIYRHPIKGLTTHNESNNYYSPCGIYASIYSSEYGWDIGTNVIQEEMT